MQHHATATFQDRARADQAIEALVSASIPHEQMRLVVRRATGEERVQVGPWRPIVPSVAVVAPFAAVATAVGLWGTDTSGLDLARNAVFTGAMAGLFGGYLAMYFWQVRASWPAVSDDEQQILTVRGSQEQARRAAEVLQPLTSDVVTGNGAPELVQEP